VNNPNAGSPPARGEGSRLRLALAAGLLFGEYLVISHRVDAMTVIGRKGVWRVAAHLGAAGPIIVTTAAAWFMLYRLRPGAQPHAPPIGAALPVSRSRWLVAHAVCFVSLLWVTDLLFGMDAAPQGSGFLWLVTWSFLASLGAVTGLLGVLGGARWLFVMPRDLRVAGPVGLLAWLGGLTSAAGLQHFISLTLIPVAELLSWLSIRAAAVPQRYLLRLAQFTLQVAPECSGHEGFGVFCTLMLVYLYLSRHELQFNRAWLALPLGLFVVWAANLLRFSVLVCIGIYFGPSIAVAGFHSKASWVLFAAISVGAAGILGRYALRRPAK
jgi:exosortase/archaeosortase family protein